MARKSARWILATLIALTFAGVVSLFALPRLRSLVESKLEHTVYSLQERLYEQTGLSLGYSYASIALPQRISFYGVELFRESRSESSVLRRKILAASELRLRLDLWAALFGSPVDLLKHMEITDLAVDLLFPEDQASLLSMAALFPAGTQGELPRLVVDIAGISLSMVQPDSRRYSASLSSLQLSTLSGAPEAIIPTALFFIADPALGKDELFVQATMLEFSAQADLSGFSASSEVAARLGGLQLASQTLTLQSSAGSSTAGFSATGSSNAGSPTASLTGRIVGEGYEAVLEYGYESKVLEAALQLAGFRPAAVLDLGPKAARGQELAAQGNSVQGQEEGEEFLKELMGLSYEGELVGRYEAGRLSYEGSLGGRG
ncbi:MAG: hypothetical protein PHT55_01315, partial [Spirochaetales bacterium]|nr:hypothetical protein [Spirochaetales bacterium]